MAQRLTTDTTEISPNMGFIPSTTGTAVVRPSADASTVSIPVVAGVHVPIDILEFDKTSSTAGQEIVVIRQGCV
jgi:hypothetical protein